MKIKIDPDVRRKVQKYEKDLKKWGHLSNRINSYKTGVVKGFYSGMADEILNNKK